MWSKSSEFEPVLPFLAIHHGAEAAPLESTHPRVDVWRDRSNAIAAWGYVDSHHAWIYMPGIGCFELMRGHSTVHATVRDDVPDGVVRGAYDRAVVPLLLQLQGFEAFHASAVTTDTGVVAFAGRSGSGKSTLAAGLRGLGFRPWADDSVIFRIPGAEPESYPIPFSTRLLSDAGAALSALNPRTPAEVPTIFSPRPLITVFSLSRDPGVREAVIAGPLTPGDAFEQLLSQAYCLGMDDTKRKRALVRAYLGLAAHACVLSLRVPATVDTLARTLEIVADSLTCRIESPPH